MSRFTRARDEHPGAGPGASSHAGPRAWPAALAVLACLGVLTAFAIGLHSAQSGARRGIENRFAERARSSAALTHSLFGSAASASSATEAKLYGGAHVSPAVLSAAAAKGKSSDLLLLDGSGRLIAASANTAPAITREVLARPYYVREVLAGKPFSLSDVRAPGTRAAAVQFAQALRTVHGLRVIVGGFSPTVLAGFISGYLQGSTTTRASRAFVIDGSGNVIASAGRGMRPLALDKGLLPAVRRSPQGPYGRDRYFAASTIAGTRWTVIVTNSRSTIFASVSGAGRWLPWALLLAFAIACATALLMTTRVLREATRQRTADARFRAAFEQQVHLAALVESSVDAIIAKTLDGTITSWNAAAQELYGYSAEEAIGQPIAMLTPPARSHEVDEIIARVRAGESQKLETKRLTKGGKLLDVAVSVSPVANAFGEVTGACVIARDISARKRAAEDLVRALRRAVEASRAKSVFVANMSHEIRTPLNGVIGMSGLLRETDLDDVQRGYVDALASSGEALLCVINDVLDFSKIEAGRLDLEVRPFEPRKIVAQACGMLASDACDKGLGLECEIAADVPAWVSGDPARLRQILLNLLSNAVKFTAQGEVRVRVDRAGPQHLRFSVSDTGVGIDPAHAARLFEAFTQADQSTTRKHGGTGLGLAISSQLARLMGGDIGASARPDGGSTFWFTARMPQSAPPQAQGAGEQHAHTEAPSALAPTASSDALDAGTRRATASRTPTAPQPTASAGDPPSIEGEHASLVLIAEDNEVNRMLAQALLHRLGLRTSVACNGREALEMASTGDYAAIFMDCQMPDIDGYEATRRIRRSETEGHVPIIAMTAHSMSGDRERCLAAGMDDYVAKPVRSEELEEVVRRWLPVRARVNGG